MNFELPEDLKMLRKVVREFATKQIAPNADEWDNDHHFPYKEAIKPMGELGFFGTVIPEAYGGTEMGWLAAMIITEEIARASSSLRVQVNMQALGCAYTILSYGTDELKNKYIEKLVEADYIGGFAITEPDAGSDTLSATTTAVKEGNEWVLNGSKVMIGNGTRGTFMLIYCLTDPDNPSRSKRHSIIAVETDRKGYKAEPMHGKMGLRCSDTAAVYLNNVRVPEDNLIGTPGNGFHQLMAFFDRSRAYVSAHGVGLAQGALDMAVKHVRGRKQFGKPIGTFQGVQFKIADMAVKIELARNIMYKAAWLLDNGTPDTHVTAMAKLYASRIAVEVVDEALQLHGGYGYFDDYDIERFYRAAKVLEIYEGAKEIEKMIIGRTIVGRT